MPNIQTKAILIIVGLFLVSCMFTWIIFRLFPTNLDASSLVTVFGGILGIIWLIMELNKHFSKAT